jgi:hypothetical protein
MDPKKDDPTRLTSPDSESGGEQPDDLQLDAGAGQGRGEEDIYAVRAEPMPQPRAEPAPGRDFRDPRVIAEKMAEAEEAESERSAWLAVRPAPPRSLLLTDTFSFPFCPNARVPAIVLLVGAVVMFATFKLAASPASAAKADGASGSLGLLALGVLFALTWACVASVFGLAILRETADGRDSVERFFNARSAVDLLFVLGGLVVGMLPGLVTAPLWDWLDWPKSLAVTISAAVLFPLLLLSMLENDSPTQPVYPPVWQSTLTAWRAWGLFYLITLPAVVCVHLLAGLALKYIPVAGAVAAGFLLAAAWMIYFRLLGRLDRFCSGRGDVAVQPQG